MRPRYCHWLLFALALSGCTSTAIRNETHSLGATSMSLRYQEILSNLAMVLDNPNAIPAYTSIYSGVARIDDSIAVSPSAIWQVTKSGASSTNFFFQGLDVPGSRQFTDTWSLDTITNPAKLRAMRAVYRWVLYGSENAGPDALSLYTYDEDPNKNTYPLGYAGYYFNVAPDLGCLPRGFVHCEPCCRCVHTSGCYSATFHGIHVWVEQPDVWALSTLALVLQRIARADASVISPGSSALPIAVTKPFDCRCDKSCDKHCDDPLVGSRSLVIAKLTANVDAAGRPLPANSTSVVPQKQYSETFGQQAELRSAVAAASKAP